MELKRCPICGSQGRTEVIERNLIGMSTFRVRYWCGCKECNIGFCDDVEFTVNHEGEIKYYKQGLKDIVEKWNTRYEEKV